MLLQLGYNINVNQMVLFFLLRTHFLNCTIEQPQTSRNGPDFCNQHEPSTLAMKDFLVIEKG